MTSQKNERGTKPDGSVPPADASFPPLFTDGSVAENAPLASSESQIVALDWLAALLDAALVVDDRAAIVEVNAPAEALFGYTRAELVGRPVEMLVPERLRARHAKHIADFFAAPRPRSRHAGLELYARHKDGSEFLVTIALSPIPAAPATLALAVARDITEHKRIEAALQRRITDLSVLNRMATIVTEAMDEDEIITRVMDEALQLVGVEFAAIRLLDQAAGELILVAHRGLGDEFVRASSRVKLGEGVSGRVAQTGEPIIVGSLAEYPGNLKPLLAQERIQSIAGVPLIGRTGLLGVMNLGAPNPDSFDSAGMQLLLTLARQMAIGIEQARLYAETRRKNRHLSVLYTMNLAASQSLNLDELLNGALTATMKALDAQTGVIYLLDADKKSMALHAHYGHSPEFIKVFQQLKSDEGISGQAIAKKKPVVLDASDYPTERLKHFIIKEKIRTAVSVPIWSAGQVVGAFTLGLSQAYTFLLQELDLLTTIGQQLGSAVQNARLYETVQQELTERKQAEEALRESEQKFRVLTEQSLLAMGIIQDGMFKYANQAHRHMTGYSIDEIMSWQPYEFAKIIHPDDRAFVMEQSQKKQAGDPDQVTHYQYRGITKTGEIKWLEMYSKTVSYQGKNANFFTFIDITERKRAEESLQRRVTDLSALNSMATIITEAMDEDEILHRVMDEALQLVGVEAATIQLLDQAAGELVLVAHRGLGDEFIRATSRMKLGEGVSGQVAQMGEPVIVSSLAEYPGGLKPLLEEEHIQSIAGVPLLGRTGLLGVMNLGAPNPDSFDSAGMQLLLTLARQMATGIEQARLYAETRRQNRRLSVLYAITRATSQSLNLEETLQNAMLATVEALEVEKGGIYLFDDDGESLVLHAHYGHSDEIIRRIQRLNPGEGISGQAIAEKQPVVLDSAEHPTERFAQFIRQQVRTLVSVPLWASGQVVGAFTLGTIRAHAFPVEERDLLTAIGQQLGSAVQNAQLYEAVQQELTERKQVEEALRESEQKFRVLSEQSLLAIGFIQDGMITYANQAFADISGYSIDEFMSWTPADQAKIIHPDDRAFVMEQGRKKQAGEPDQATNYQYRVIAKSGETKWLDLYSKTVLYQGRNASFFMIIDITERKQAEEALHKERWLLQKAEQISNLGAWEWDIITGDFIVSENWRQIHGAQKSSLSVESLYKLAYPDDIPEINKLSEEVFRREKPVFDLEHRIVRLDNQEVRYVRALGELIFDEANQPIKMYGATQDITERKRAEKMLQRYNQRLMILHEIDRNIIMARSPEIIADIVLAHIRRLIPCWRASVLLYEPDTDEIVVLASAANGETAIQPGVRFAAPAEQMSQMSLTERYYLVEDIHTLSEPIPPLVRLAIAEGTRAYLNVLLAGEQSLIGALTLGSKTPKAFTEEDIEITIEIANQIAIAIHQARLKEAVERYSADLERRVAQRTAQLEAANKELESFSYSVSHDLRAPLRAINGFAAIIARRHRPNLNEEGQHYVNNIVLASDRMGFLIDDLLQYSRLGRGGARREPVPLGEVFDPLASDLAGQLAEIGGTLSIADDLPTVIGDRTLLGRVFANLLENAVTYRQADVPLQVTISCQVDGQDVSVCVADNGIGIPAEYYNKVFNIFQRLHSEDEYPGTGIGLATVKKSVELLGGRAWIESVVGEGSKFFIQLPKE